MKKRFIVISVYVLVAIILQTSVLAFINYKYLAGFSEEDKTVESKNVHVEPKPVEKKNLIEDNAVDIKVSDSSKYVSYIKDNQLKYMDLEKKELKLVTDSKPYIYKWLYDDKILFINNIAETSNYDFYIYNLETGEKKLVTTLKLKDENEKIDNIINSTLKNLIFIHVKGYGRSRLLKLNIEQAVFEDVAIQCTNIESLFVIPHEDKVIYKGENVNRLYISYIGKNILFRENGQQVLLGVDDSDRVFVGIQRGEFITSVYYGLINEGLDSWTKIQVKGNVKKEDIIITRDGKILENNQTDKVIRSVVGDKEMKYKGTYLSIDKSNILSIINNEVTINSAT
ncbi:hypothetical protein [Clostridium manihotivorum]|uniref:Uncharacterized protein n=1 Tax=Clostridium manihotivorum TaxID=2320868 RepID=A0A3R5U2V4_9CLOT|nr:hypothetical protein [Clostridium manihotivorum]QAA30213.1 hypothetical protein C1I91_00030 [Clostridium manihotivorum]